YIQANYMLGRYIDVKWVDGNQNFDAEIFQSGFYIDKNYFSSHHYLEVTIAEHPNEYLSREILDIEGGAFSVEGFSRNKDKKIISGPVVNDGDDFIKNFSDILVQRI